MTTFGKLRTWVRELNLLPRVVGGLITAALAGLSVRFWRNPLVLVFIIVIGVVLLAGVGVMKFAKRLKRLNDRLERSLAPANSPPLPIAVKDPERTLLYVMGVDVGRTKTVCGVLTVPSSDAVGLPGHAAKSSRPHQFDVKIGKEVYQRIVQAAQLEARQVGRLDGIGIGVPGQVNAVDGIIDRSPAGFRHGEPFVDTLIDEISTCPEVMQALGIDSREVGEAERHALRGLIHLDNDVNCGARAVLNGHLRDDRWTNFACIFVGTGAGAGLVLNKEVFYGSSGAAGEIGHMSLASPPQASPTPTAGGVRGAEQSSCACGREGAATHWERLVNGSGLVNICRSVDPELYEVLREDSNKGPTSMTIVSAAARCFESGGYLAEPTSQGREFEKIVTCARYESSLMAVLDLHAEFTAVGIGNLGNLLNLDHVVLGGGLLDGLMSLPLYREKLDEHLQAHSLKVPYNALRLEKRPEGQAKYAWQGGALLFFDRSYIRFRKSA